MQSLENLENLENGLFLESVRENLEKSMKLKWNLLRPGKRSWKFCNIFEQINELIYKILFFISMFSFISGGIRN